VQRTWRGFKDRKRIRTLLTEAVSRMRLQYYMNTAIKIQKVWRGFYTRKYIYNFYSRKRYLEAIQEKNQAVREELAEVAERHIANQTQEQERNLQERVTKWARKNHHLMGTQVQWSIYNSPYLSAPMPEEHLLRSVQPMDHSPKKLSGKHFDPAWRRYGPERPTKLPPLTDKPQGPFRKPQEVQDQRYRPFNPSLRVETDFDSLTQARNQLRQEEWVARLHDENFIPVRSHTPPYRRTLHSTSDYGHLSYGTEFFREMHQKRHITSERFQTMVLPIPVFEKLNSEYVEGYVES